MILTHYWVFNRLFESSDLIRHLGFLFDHNMASSAIFADRHDINTDISLSTSIVLPTFFQLPLPRLDLFLTGAIDCYTAKHELSAEWGGGCVLLSP